MPNICWWTIKFYGPSKELREHLRYANKNSTPSIEEFVCPMPPEIKATTLPNSWSDDWYERSCKNRGSKRWTYDHYIQEDDDEHIEITFSTAWSPINDEILEKLSKHCESLTYNFDEIWMWFSWVRSVQDWGFTEYKDYEDGYYGKAVICLECWCHNGPEDYECGSCEYVLQEG